MTLPKPESAPYAKGARFKILAHVDGSLCIKDLGPWDEYPTVTNDAEWVVYRLVSIGLLARNGRLWYYDSEDRLDEIIVRDGRFAGFRAASADAGAGLVVDRWIEEFLSEYRH